MQRFPTDCHHFESRLEKLESQIAFQDLTIEELNQSLIALQLEISHYREQLRQLTNKLNAVSSAVVAPLSEETPPPHY